MKLIFQYLKGHKLLFLLNVLCAGSFAFAELGIPTIFGNMVDSGIEAGNTSALWGGFRLILLVALISGAGMIMLSYVSTRLSTTIVYEIRKSLFEHVMKFSVAELDHFTVASLITRTNTDCYQILQFCNTLFRAALLAPVMLCVSIWLIVQTSFSLSWIILGTIPIIIAGAVFVFRLASPLSSRQQKLTDRINEILREDITGVRVVRSFNREETEEKRFDVENQEFRKATSTLFKIMNLTDPLFFFVMNLAAMLIYYTASLAISHGTMQIGQLLMFVEYLFHCMMSILVVCSIFMVYPMAAISSKRILEVLDTPPSVYSCGNKPLEKIQSVEFDDVSFAYPQSSTHSLSNISFKAQAGQRVAIIGATGSGKSTIARLLCRFYDPQQGSIRINGCDIREYSLDSLRKKVAMVSQKAHMFSGTIKDNILFSNPDASDKDLEKAIAISQSGSFIEQRAQGLDDWISEEGSNLSGGQKQRLSIARAVAANAGLYILDDSFSALDLMTDAKLRKALEPLQDDALFLIVAQRISSIAGCDQILVLDKGRIAAAGTHQQLLAESDLYRQIVLSQMSEQEAMRYGR